MNGRSILNRREIAEEALLKFLRDQGVFAPPEKDYAFTSQTIRFDMLLHAVVTYWLAKGGDPRPILRVLNAETLRVTDEL